MSTTITVRDLDPGDKSWLKREAHRLGISMEALVRRLIHKNRKSAQRRAVPSEVFKRHFGPEHGVDLPPRRQYRYRLVEFQDEEGA